jgi:nicotinamide riboside transporter PnuC
VTRVLIGMFFVAHGLIHAAIWLSPPSDDAPMQVGRSWLLGDVRPLSVVLAIVAAAAFVVAGSAYLTSQDWWAVTALGGAAVSTVLMALTFTPWWLAAIAINVVVVYQAWPGSVEVV